MTEGRSLVGYQFTSYHSKSPVILIGDAGRATALSLGRLAELPSLCETRRMRRPLAVVLGLAAYSFALAQTPPPTNQSPPIAKRFLIAPSSSSLAGGTARLVVGALSREPGTYVGAYRIKVFPYFFKSESGRLSMQVSDVALLKLTQGVAVELAGRATTNGTGKTRAIMAWAKPSTSDCGALIFAVTTLEGKLIFNTSYRLER